MTTTTPVATTTAAALPSTSTTQRLVQSTTTTKKSVRFSTTPGGNPHCTIHPVPRCTVSTSTVTVDDDREEHPTTTTTPRGGPRLLWWTRSDVHQMIQAQAQAIREQRQDPQCVRRVEQLFLHSSHLSPSQLQKARQQLAMQYPETRGLERFISKRVMRRHVRQRQAMLRHLRAQQQQQQQQQQQTSAKTSTK